MRAMPFIILLAACAPDGLVPGAAFDMGGPKRATDMGGPTPPPELGDTTPLFAGIFVWDSPTASSKTVCDNGASSNDAPPSGNFMITRGPAANQVNIGAGTNACPIFLFSVNGGVATMANPGVRCKSGPGEMTTRTGTLTALDGGNTLSLALVLDLKIPDGLGSTHCVLTVTGMARRR